MKENTWWNKWNDTIREVHEMFKTTDTNTLKQDKKVSVMLVHCFVNHVWNYNIYSTTYIQG